MKWRAGRVQANAAVLGVGSQGAQSQEAEQKPQHHLRGTQHGGGVHSETWRMTRLLLGWGAMGELSLEFTVAPADTRVQEEEPGCEGR